MPKIALKANRINFCQIGPENLTLRRTLGFSFCNLCFVTFSLVWFGQNIIWFLILVGTIFIPGPPVICMNDLFSFCGMKWWRNRAIMIIFPGLLLHGRSLCYITIQCVTYITLHFITIKTIIPARSLDGWSSEESPSNSSSPTLVMMRCQINTESSIWW